MNKYSSRITQPPSQGTSQAMLHATGLTRADLDKAQVGIPAVWFEGNSCNMHLNDLAASVKRGVVEAGLVGMRFNTIGVSDGISMGTDGTSYSLQSRDLIADLKPSGKYLMEDLHDVGGTPAVLRHLLSKGVLHGDCLTVTGKTLAENLADLPDLSTGQDVIQPWMSPIKATGHITIMRGNLAPEGSVAKITGKEGLRFQGPAKVFDCEEDMLLAMERGEITKDNVVVIRYEGPKGGPGMPEMLSPTSVIMGADLGKDVALVIDGRFSGGSHGFIIGHITPEAQEGGPIALVRDGDMIAIDAETRCIEVKLDQAELAKRRAA